MFDAEKQGIPTLWYVAGSHNPINLSLRQAQPQSSQHLSDVKVVYISVELLNKTRCSARATYHLLMYKKIWIMESLT